MGLKSLLEDAPKYISAANGGRGSGGPPYELIAFGTTGAISLNALSRTDPVAAQRVINQFMQSPEPVAGVLLSIAGIIYVCAAAGSNRKH